MILCSRVRLRTVLKNKFVIYYTQKKIKVHGMPVQQQKNKTDCGIYAISFAYFIANDIHPSIASLEETRSKKHLYFCF